MWAKLANIKKHSQTACLHFFCLPLPLLYQTNSTEQIADAVMGPGEVPFALGAGSCHMCQDISDEQWCLALGFVFTEVLPNADTHEQKCAFVLLLL